jgi:hypothetical protein
MIKIISGYSHVGGSTVAFKNLALEFMKRGIPCEFYGPHDWHLQFGSFCKNLNDLRINRLDNLITHFIDLNLPKENKVILSCHEMYWFDFTKVSKYYNKVQFLTEKQAKFHNTVTDYVIIPNVKEVININRTEDAKNVAGVIGNIDERKNPIGSINKALEDGCRKVLLFGQVLNPEYFTRNIVPLLHEGKVSYMGYEKSKERIYSLIDRVYHLSRGEVASLVKDECYATGTLFFGNENTDHEVSTLTNDQVIDMWRKEFEI